MTYDWKTFETNEKLRDACTERNAQAGDPPCWALNPEMGIYGGVDCRYKPCGECLRDAGIEPGDEFDEAAAAARLL